MGAAGTWAPRAVAIDRATLCQRGRGSVSGPSSKGKDGGLEVSGKAALFTGMSNPATKGEQIQISGSPAKRRGSSTSAEVPGWIEAVRRLSSTAFEHACLLGTRTLQVRREPSRELGCIGHGRRERSERVGEARGVA